MVASQIWHVVMRIRSVSPGLMFLFLQFVFPLPSPAQLDQSSLLSATSVGTSTSNYYFARPNELTIIVNVFGYVEKPGRYEISSSIDLVNLLALAGGPTSEGTLNGIRIVRMIKTDDRVERTEKELDLEDLTKVNLADLTLQPGDVIRVESSGWSVRDVINAVSTGVLLTTAVLNIIVLSKR